MLEILQKRIQHLSRDKLDSVETQKAEKYLPVLNKLQIKLIDKKMKF